MIKKIKVNGKNVRLSRAYMYGDISVLYIDGRDTSVAMWAPVTEERMKEYITEGVRALYGEDAQCTMETI